MSPQVRTPGDKPAVKKRRRKQRAADMAKEERNRRRAIGGGQSNELGVLQGQSGEQGPPTDARFARRKGPIRH